MSNIPNIFDKAIKIQHGAARSIGLSELPAHVAAKLDPDVPQVYAPRSLPVIVREIARLSNRMIPTTDIYLVPSIRYHTGLAFHDLNSIMIDVPKAFCNSSQTAWALNHTIEVLFHETWHICSKRLKPELYKACADVVKGGMALGDPAYYDIAEERLARLFSHWAMSVWMGWQSAEDDPATHQTTSAVFAGIYSGYFAQVLADQEGRAA